MEITLDQSDFQQPNGEVDFWRDCVTEPLGLDEDVTSVTLHVVQVDAY